MKNISAEVSIFSLWTDWRHLVTCRKIELRELYYCNRCALDKICEIYTFDRLAKNHSWLLATQKKGLESNWTESSNCISKRVNISRFLPFITLRNNSSCVYFVALRIAQTVLNIMRKSISFDCYHAIYFTKHLKIKISFFVGCI